MVPHATVNHVPTLMGGEGAEQLLEFYSTHFIPKMPADVQITPISRTIASEVCSPSPAPPPPALG